MHRHLFLFALGLLCSQLPLAAQLSTGSLQGAYYVRQVAMEGYPYYAAYSAQGTATFDGKGGFTFQGTEVDTTRSSSTPQNFSFTGQYTLTSGGILSMSSLLSSDDSVYGGFANNVVVASSTESAYYDLLVALPVSQNISNSTLNGNYRFVSLDFLFGQYAGVRNGSFLAAANGQGSLGNLSITGQAANLNNAAATQTLNGAQYSLNGNGTGTLTLPTSGTASSLLVSGNKTVYVSADGGLVIGGSANGFDMILGVRVPAASASTFQGLYFQAGLELDNTGGDLANTSQLLAYSGSLKGNGQGAYVANTRFNLDGYSPFDQTFGGQNAVPDASGLLDFGSFRYYFGANGDLALGVGTNGNYELSLLVRAPVFAPTGTVFLDPTGVANAASFAPITNPIAPGELITLFGSGLASQLTIAPALPFATSLGGVQVTVNGTAAPIYYVSPTQVSVVVPYSLPTDGALADIQVTSGGVASNVVQAYTALTAPGIFTQGQSGVGTGALLRQNSTLVSSSNPATKGETIQIFLTGLGAVIPASPAGAAGPTNPFSVVSGNLQVVIDGQPARISYAGLAPGLAGLYQINVVVPNNVSSGNVAVGIATDDAYHTQVTLPIQ